jgi:hypothetical protein
MTTAKHKFVRLGLLAILMWNTTAASGAPSSQSPSYRFRNWRPSDQKVLNVLEQNGILKFSDGEVRGFQLKEWRDSNRSDLWIAAAVFEHSGKDVLSVALLQKQADEFGALDMYHDSVPNSTALSSVSDDLKTENADTSLDATPRLVDLRLDAEPYTLHHISDTDIAITVVVEQKYYFPERISVVTSEYWLWITENRMNEILSSAGMQINSDCHRLQTACKFYRFWEYPEFEVLTSKHDGFYDLLEEYLTRNSTTGTHRELSKLVWHEGKYVPSYDRTANPQ